MEENSSVGAGIRDPERIERRTVLHISYRPLWHLLLDRDMNKQKLREVTGLSSSSMAKLGKGESITTEMLVRICSKLDCDLTDIMELVDDDGEPVRNRLKKAEAN